MSRLGRNDKCPCGSGRKVKQCYGMRRIDPQPPSQERADTIRELFEVKKCFHFDAPTACVLPIIRAHTIQECHLDLIARDHKVYSFRMEPGFSIGTGEAKEKLVATGMASTLRCFCKAHDQALFSPIEDDPYNGTSQQLFLYGYRAIVFSYYTRLCGHEGYKWKLSNDYSKSMEEHIQRHRYFLSRLPEIRLREQEFATLKDQFDTNLHNSDFTDLRSFVVELDHAPALMCAFARGAVYDFRGNILQSLTASNPKADIITCTLTATDKGGAIIFTWLGKSEVNERFVSSLDQLNDAELSFAVARYVFDCSNNLFASPDWWDGLDKDMRLRLRHLRMGPGPGKVTADEYVKTPYRYQDEFDLMPIQFGIVGRLRNF